MTPPGSRSWLRDLSWAALDLVVPQDCAGCGQPGRAWCPACAAACEGPTLVVPGLVLPGPAVPGPAVPGPAVPGRVEPTCVACRAAAGHDGPAGRAVVAFKDHAARSLARPLAGLLAGAVGDVLIDLAADPAPLWLVPVPTRAAARRTRGADHVQVLADRAARALRALGLPANAYPALEHVRASRDQVGLDRQQRRANVAGTLRAHRVPAGVLVVVDDVTTTGATLGEALRALRAVDARRPGAATVTWAGEARASRPRVRGTSVEGEGAVQ